MPGVEQAAQVLVAIGLRSEDGTTSGWDQRKSAKDLSRLVGRRAGWFGGIIRMRAVLLDRVVRARTMRGCSGCKFVCAFTPAGPTAATAQANAMTANLLFNPFI